MKSCAYLLAVVMLSTGTATADDCRSSGSPMCSKTFYGSGRCDEKDQLVPLKDAKGWPGNPIINAWEDRAITIVGIEITVFSPPKTIKYAYAGNGATPNQMLFLGPGQTHARVFYPQGLGFRLPPASADGFKHVDLHMSCSGGEYQLFYTLFYTLASTTGPDEK